MRLLLACLLLSACGDPVLHVATEPADLALSGLVPDYPDGTFGGSPCVQCLLPLCPDALRQCWADDVCAAHFECTLSCAGGVDGGVHPAKECTSKCGEHDAAYDVMRACYSAASMDPRCHGICGDL